MMRTGLIGWPLGHSLSPQIHKIAFEMAGISGNYDLYPIAPNSMSDLEKILIQVRSQEIQGLNVTIPLKISIIPLLDDLEGGADRYQAVNTVFLKDHKLIGTNTDGPGFKRDMEVCFGTEVLRGKTALVFGAGGSAKAVLAELIENGMFVTIVVRNRERALNLLSRFNISEKDNFVIIENGQINQRTIDGVDLIINATPLGMVPDIDGMPISENLILNHNQCIYDLVYNPTPTQLTKKALREGAKACNGFGMLVEQALLAFEIWTGISIPRDEFFKHYQLANGEKLP